MTTTAEIRERHDKQSIPTWGNESVLLDWSRIHKDRGILLDRLKMYEDFDTTPDDADWQPPHPIFLLAEERDEFMKRARNAEQTIAAISELPDKWRKKITAFNNGKRCLDNFITADRCADELQATIGSKS